MKACPTRPRRAMPTPPNPSQIQERHSKIRRDFFESEDTSATERESTLKKELQIASLFDADYQGVFLILHCFDRIESRTGAQHYPAAVDLALKIALAQIPNSLINSLTK